MPDEIESRLPEAFICYKSDDLERVNEIREILESQDISIWQDKTGVSGSQNWMEEAGPAIRDCKVILLMCTNISLKSPKIQAEVALGDEYGKPLIPLHLERNLVKPDAMKLLLILKQDIKILDRPPEEWLPELLSALKKLHVSFRPGPPPAPPSELMETIGWLQKLRRFVETARQDSATSTDEDEEMATLKRSVDGAVDYLITIDSKLPRLYRTLVALARRRHVTSEDSAALCRLQSSLVDVARLAWRLSIAKPGGTSELPMPPYDLWLPFKDRPDDAPTRPPVY